MNFHDPNSFVSRHLIAVRLAVWAAILAAVFGIGYLVVNDAGSSCDDRYENCDRDIDNRPY